MEHKCYDRRNKHILAQML